MIYLPDGAICSPKSHHRVHYVAKYRVNHLVCCWTKATILEIYFDSFSEMLGESEGQINKLDTSKPKEMIGSSGLNTSTDDCESFNQVEEESKVFPTQQTSMPDDST